MTVIHVTSEIAPLKKILLHRPGRELERLTPDSLKGLLFDDIPYLRVAQKEHDDFAELLRGCGIEVLYLERLAAEAIAVSPEIRDAFLLQWIREAGIHTEKWQKRIYDHMMEFAGEPLTLIQKTMEGLVLGDVYFKQTESLVDMKSDSSKLLIDPMPNLYFTRDPFATIGNGVSLNRMYARTRARETIYGEYIFRYHPQYAGKVKLFYDRDYPFHIEGGDILNLSEHVLAVGISQRTQPEAIEHLAKNIFASEDVKIDTILAFDIPQARAFMHLDTVFTQIDYDKFSIHPGILGPLVVYEMTRGRREDTLNVTRVETSLERILEKHLEIDRARLIRCGGEDRIASEREQWNDGSNTLAIAPGVVVVYQRNEVTNEMLRQAGVTVWEIPSAELSRGRGGPRCMSMPLVRE